MAAQELPANSQKAAAARVALLIMQGLKETVLHEA